MAKLKTFIFLGQSNMEGEGDTSSFTTNDFSKYFGQSAFTVAAPFAEVPSIMHWQANLLTSTRGPAGDPLQFYDGKFTPMKYGVFGSIPVFYNGYLDGYDYPTNQTQPRVNAHDYFPTIGPDLECQWQIQHYLGEVIWCIKLSIPSAYGTKYLDILPAITSVSQTLWWNGKLHNDWHPGSTFGPPGAQIYDLFDVLVEKIIKGKATDWINANRPGDVMDIQGVFEVEGESDATEQPRALLTYEVGKLRRDTFRKRIAAAKLTSLGESKIPWVFCGNNLTAWPFTSIVNANYQKLAADDPYTGYVTDQDLPTLSNSIGHINGAAAITLGKRFSDKWLEIKRRIESANVDVETRPTLTDLKTAVLQRYQRNVVTNDAFTEVLAQFINDSNREIYNTLGDSAWFLRRIENFSVSTNANVPVELPKVVRRPILIERSDLPGQMVNFEMQGYSDQGACIIRLCDVGTFTYTIHHMYVPPDLTVDTDVSPVPPEYTELTVLLTCKRLAEQGGSTETRAYFTEQSAEQWKKVWHSVEVADRPRNNGLYAAGFYNFQDSQYLRRSETYGYLGY